MAISFTKGAVVAITVAGNVLTFASTATTTGQDIYVVISILSTSVSVSSITDTALNSYTLQASKNGTGIRIEIWACHGITGNAANILVVHLSSSAATAAAAYGEYAGVSSIGNIGTGANGNSAYAEADVATQDGTNWLLGGTAVASSSGDTYTADCGTIRESDIPAATTASVGMIDSSSVAIVSALRSAILISTARQWAAVAIELRSGGGAINVGTPISIVMTGLAAGSYHQIVKAPGQPSTPSGPATPVPIGVVLKGGIKSTAYSETITAQGGSGSGYVYSLASGSLPTGTSLTGATGVIAGTPSAAGTFTFTIGVVDSLGNTGSQNFSITIANPSAGGGSWTYAS